MDPGNSNIQCDPVNSNKNHEEQMRQHYKDFGNKRVIKVTDGIFVAVGYGLANSIMLEGPTGLVIVDVTESYKVGQEIYAEFRKITTKPIEAIVYTHFHADHTMGGQAYVENESKMPDIWGYHTMIDHLRTDLAICNETMMKRGLRQFGVRIPRKTQLGAGIGPRLNFNPGSGQAMIYPNKLMYQEKLTLTYGGLTFELIHIPGETPDQIGVWVPGKKAFLPADDIYRAFPNLYAIRGTPHRDAMTWVRSIDKMRKLRPEFLVPCHTLPQYGAESIYQLLTDYRDAIQYVHDQTVRYMNKGLYPDEIAELVHLPQKLADHPYLQELYGTVAWSVRGIFHGYMGWFSGDPVDLMPQTRTSQAGKMVELVGGTDKVLEAAKKALSGGDPQWGLELATYVLFVDPDNVNAKDIKVQCCYGLGPKCPSTNGRNYYIACALEAAGGDGLKSTPATQMQAGHARLAFGLPLDDLLLLLTLRLKAEACADFSKTIAMNFTDVKQTYYLCIRNAMVELTTETQSNINASVNVVSTVWRNIMAGKVNFKDSLQNGNINIDGDIGDLLSFWQKFDFRNFDSKL
ncbi:unnamed protein product [Owenia fusiformis]|uniref:Uncharacterized protein n=1 Tax=Owenia fusiformis TaxID=6347 RepID=A0A8J1TW21_OWEFU|nr:unnamed protein product [Owenia fusiformis]